VPQQRRSQAERSEATRASLVSAARALFAERGYDAVPTDEIVQAARVTRGALYHHFGGKQQLLRTVVEQLEAEMTTEVAAAPAEATDAGSRAFAALGRFLELCQRDEVVRISLTDAPAVLGWAAWREIESRHGLALINASLQAAAAEGTLLPEPTPELAQLVLSACNEAALMIAHAEDRAAAKATAEQALVALLSGMVSR
jgi:AcrR family transcriptional regulator